MTAQSEEDLRELARRCIRAGTAKRITFATAESCTGGLMANLVTDIEGTSVVYMGGWVVYDNRRKTEDLDVDAVTIERDGAVSEAVAKALADGARRRSGATLGIATTGIAGPTGGSPEKPVGTVWIGLATPDLVYALRVEDDQGDRVQNKRVFAARAFELLTAAIDAYPEAPEFASDSA